MPNLPYGQTVTLIRRVLSGQDEFGNNTYSDQPVSVGPCVVAPQGSSEDVQFTDQVTDNIVVYIPYGTPVGPLDAIGWQGKTYEIQGTPQNWTPSPFSGNTAPIEVRARLVTGASV
jgi:hypothetical protein